MRRSTWGVGALALLCAAVAAQQTPKPTGTSDDRKEPHTLNNLLTPEPRPAERLVSSAETIYLPETNMMGLTPREPAQQALDVKSGKLERTVEGVRLSGYQSRPAKGEPTAALLLVHEWWGVNAALKAQADQLANKGYQVFALDLYGGKQAENRQQAARLMSQVQPDKAQAQLKAALAMLAKGEQGKARKVGVVGWGLGASQALRLATTDARPAALVLFYGDLLKDPAQLARINAPVLGFFCEQDEWVTPKKVQAFKDAMLGAQKAIKTYSFPTLPGFALAPQDPAQRGYAETAQETMLDFLQRHLEP